MDGRIMLQGGDISKWQNTSAVDLFRDFVIIKATEGVGYVDPTCDTKYQYAKRKGKLLGVYHFARPDLSGAVAEADYFINNTTGYWKAKEAILVLDWETGNKADVNWALTWLRRVRDRTGIKPLIYMSASTLGLANWSAVVKEDFGLWIAGYPNKYNVANPPVPANGEMPYNTSPWGFAAIWQYTSSAGTLDRDVAYMSRDAWSKYAGKVAAPPAPVVTTKDETKTTAIPFDTVRNPDNTKLVGEELVVQDGVDGKHVVITRITYTDGKETNRQVISDKTFPATNKVMYYGTKEAPSTMPDSNDGTPNTPPENYPSEPEKQPTENDETNTNPSQPSESDNSNQSQRRFDELVAFLKQVWAVVYKWAKDFWNMK